MGDATSESTVVVTLGRSDRDGIPLSEELFGAASGPVVSLFGTVFTSGIVTGSWTNANGVVYSEETLVVVGLVRNEDRAALLAAELGFCVLTAQEAAGVVWSDTGDDTVVQVSQLDRVSQETWGIVPVWPAPSGPAIRVGVDAIRLETRSTPVGAVSLPFAERGFFQTGVK